MECPKFQSAVKKCPKSIFKKLSFTNIHNDKRRDSKSSTKQQETQAEGTYADKKTHQIKVECQSNGSKEQHSTEALAEFNNTTLLGHKPTRNTHSNRLSQSEQALQCALQTKLNINADISLTETIPRKPKYEQNRPTSISTPVTPVSTLTDHNRFNLSYSKSSASNNSSSCSDEEELLTPSTTLSPGQWLSGNPGKTGESSKNQQNGTLFLEEMRPNSFFVFADDRAPCTPVASTSCSATKKGNKDRSNSQRSCISTGSLDNSSSSSISIFGKSSEFEKKVSKAIRMWHSTVEKLAMQEKIALHSEQKRIKTKSAERDSAVSRFIISELYYTEKSYHAFLLFIRSNHMEPMQIASHSKNPLVKPTDVHVLFYHLPDLISISEKLLGKLEVYAKNGPKNDVDSPGVAVGRIFKEMEDDFAVFLKYAIHYQGHMKAIRRASNTGCAIKIDRESKACRKENNRLGLADYLIAPFQRVPRYELLIKDLLKHTNTENPQHAHELAAAKHIISGLAATMNMVQEKIPKSLFSSSFYSSTSQSTTNLVALNQQTC